jgi:hypothetical protein
MGLSRPSQLPLFSGKCRSLLPLTCISPFLGEFPTGFEPEGRGLQATLRVAKPSQPKAARKSLPSCRATTLEFNPSAQRIFGCALKEARGRLAADLIIPSAVIKNEVPSPSEGRFEPPLFGLIAYSILVQVAKAP